jgi:2',3'-cyclic-nucleotide 2'-phosphodiesterase (5'-nucleotidase family)
MMHKYVRKTVSSCWLILLLLLISAPLALAQQPAPASQPPAAKPQAPASRNVNARVTETLIDSSIKDDPAVDKMLAVYGPKVRALDVVIGKLKGELRKGGAGAGSLGNFVADGMRAQASIRVGRPVDLALMNGGGLRRDAIGEGDLRARDIFELLPFENVLVTLELNGEQLKRLLEVIVSSREAQSGAWIVYKTNAQRKQEMESAKLRDAQNREHDIDPRATYTVVTIDYLYKRGGDQYGVLREGKNVKELGITHRDAIMDYVKAETAAGRDLKPNLDGRFVLDRANSVLSGEAPPKAGQNRLR